MRIGFIIGGLALAVLVIGAWQWWASSQNEELELVPVEVSEPAPTPPTPGLPEPDPETVEPVLESGLPELVEIEVPPLNESDEYVREVLAPLTVPDAWLAPDDLARRLAVVVDNTARGQVPRRQLSFLTPKTPFKVFVRGDETYLDPVNYQRFDSYVDMLEAVEPETVAVMIDELAPLLQQALGELGNQLSVADQARVAIDQILAVPVRRDEIRLVQPKVIYQFAEPRLEAMTPLQKQVLRMGPDNIERLQAYLQQLRPLL
jgi:hypothetical protein